MKRSTLGQLLQTLLIATLLITGCVSVTPQAENTPVATVPSSPTPLPTVDVATPETIGRAFLAAWEAADYAQMYGLLLPSLRNGLALEDFQQAYRSPLDTTTTISPPASKQRVSGSMTASGTPTPSSGIRTSMCSMWTAPRRGVPAKGA